MYCNAGHRPQGSACARQVLRHSHIPSPNVFSDILRKRELPRLTCDSMGHTFLLVGVSYYHYSLKQPAIYACFYLCWHSGEVRQIWGVQGQPWCITQRKSGYFPPFHSLVHGQHYPQSGLMDVRKSRVVVHYYNPCIQETEEGQSWVWGQPSCIVRACLRKPEIKKSVNK